MTQQFPIERQKFPPKISHKLNIALISVQNPAFIYPVSSKKTN